MVDHHTYDLPGFALQSGVTLPRAQLAYQTYGELAAARDNVVLMPTIYGAQHADTEAMIGEGRALDRLFLDGVRAALIADAAFADGRYVEPPVKGLHAFSVVYAGWAFSQDFFREEEYRKLGLGSVEDVAAFLEGYFGRHDANDLLATLWTWHNADISANDRFKGDLTAALRAITARAIVMPGETDLYFRVRDNELEVAEMPNAELRPIPSIWGHAAGFGVHQPDNEFIDQALRELLAG